MITGVQIRAARAALKWSAEDLAENTGLASKTIRRLEAEAGIPNSTTATLKRIGSVFEAAGIEFIGSPDDAPGIRIHPRPDQISDD